MRPIFRTRRRFLRRDRVIKFDRLAFRSRYTDRIIRPDFIPRPDSGGNLVCHLSLERLHARARACVSSSGFVGVRGQLNRVCGTTAAEYRRGDPPQIARNVIHFTINFYSQLDFTFAHTINFKIAISQNIWRSSSNERKKFMRSVCVFR